MKSREKYILKSKNNKTYIGYIQFLGILIVKN